MCRYMFLFMSFDIFPRRGCYNKSPSARTHTLAETVDVKVHTLCVFLCVGVFCVGVMRVCVCLNICVYVRALADKAAQQCPVSKSHRRLQFSKVSSLPKWWHKNNYKADFWDFLPGAHRRVCVCVCVCVRACVRHVCECAWNQKKHIHVCITWEWERARVCVYFFINAVVDMRLRVSCKDASRRRMMRECIRANNSPKPVL